MENAGGLGRHLSQRLVAAGESVVDVPPRLSARVRVLSSGNARKNDGLDALATALAAWRNERLPTVDPEAESEVLCASFPRGAKTWWPSVPGRSTASTDSSCGTSFLAGYRGHSRPTELHASCAAYGRPQGSSAGVRRRLASEILRDLRTLERKIANLNEQIEEEVEASGTTLTEIFGMGPIP